MEHIYLAHLLLVIILLLFPKNRVKFFWGAQQVVLLIWLWLDLLNHLYRSMSHQIYFWELCAFYERTFGVEGMFWILFLYHHIAAFVGLLLMVDYLRNSALFTFFWTFLAAYPLLLNWWQSEPQLDLDGHTYYALPQLSTINRDVTSLVVELNLPLTFSYLIGAFSLMLLLFFIKVKQGSRSLPH